MNEELKTWEAWECEDGSITFSTAEGIRASQEPEGSKPVRLLHSLQAATHEEARSISNLRMGLDPYQPNGQGVKCPNGCGSFYYPEGSGDCPYCGNV
jgi:hypothetical protein